MIRHERMRISINGNVGIGVTIPGFCLEIGAGTVSTGSLSQRWFNVGTALTLSTKSIVNVSLK